jgi:serine/threonine protein kinase
VERLQKVLAADPASSENIDLYYWLAAAHEAAGNASQALTLYEKIQSEDLRYRDVEARVERLLSADRGQPAPIPRPAPPARGASTPTAIAAAGAGSPPASAPAPAPPAKPARFERKEEVGRGPLGVVYRAEDTRDGRNVALRALPGELLRAPGAAAELVADLKAAATFSHPNVAKVLGLVDSQGDKCVVTEFVAGRTFAEALRAGHKMAFQQAHSLGRVLMQALGAVHGNGLVHGSVQPSNVMVAQGVVKLTDLGLGRFAARLPAPGYRAPESQLDKAGDLYAVAAVLYHLLTGTHPRSLPQGTGLPLPSSLATGVPEAFDKLLVRCLHPRVELRYASADDVLRELKDMVRIG